MKRSAARSKGARLRRSWGRMSLKGTSNSALSAVLPARPWSSRSWFESKGAGKRCLLGRPITRIASGTIPFPGPWSRPMTLQRPNCCGTKSQAAPAVCPEPAQVGSFEHDYAQGKKAGPMSFAGFSATLLRWTRISISSCNTSILRMNWVSRRVLNSRASGLDFSTELRIHCAGRRAACQPDLRF